MNAAAISIVLGLACLAGQIAPASAAGLPEILAAAKSSSKTKTGKSAKKDKPSKTAATSNPAATPLTLEGVPEERRGAYVTADLLACRKYSLGLMKVRARLLKRLMRCDTCKCRIAEGRHEHTATGKYGNERITETRALKTKGIRTDTRELTAELRALAEDAALCAHSLPLIKKAIADGGYDYDKDFAAQVEKSLPPEAKALGGEKAAGGKSAKSAKSDKPASRK